MIDKIIIDGVDVSKCKQRDKYAISLTNDVKCYNYGLCKGVDCLYKQLQHKEKECNKYKQALEKVFGNYKTLLK